MHAEKLWMLREFIGTNKVLFRIPVYQRNYDWAEEHCNKLLDDIKTIIDTGEKHFIGTIVVMAAQNGGFQLQDYIIIDGQQRLTTMMIILKCLANLAKECTDPCESEINDTYLHNRYCEEKFKVKLKPIKMDNEQFSALLNDNLSELKKDGHIYLNYAICKDRMTRWVKSGIAPSNILEALTKLEIVNIALDKGVDDPQIIFESINSTGQELSHADLIRNFLLMNADNQDDLYEQYWLYIENKLKRNTVDYTNLNQFFMQYIVFKTNAPLNEKALYKRFVRLYKENNYTQERILQELKYYADVYEAFVYDKSKYSEAIKKPLKKIRMLRQTTVYPFLLHVFDDFEQHVISEDILKQVLDLVVAYLLRRMTCGVPSNSLRGFFIYLYNRVFKVVENKAKYYEAINKFLFTLTSKDIMPPAREFKRALQEINMYEFDRLCKFILMDIENGNSKEILQADKLTIEHIMPQTLSADWRYILEEDHEQYQHVLGNLTVTGYNSELSNKNFTEKKEIIKNSKAIILNSDVINKATWGIAEIKTRGERLAKIIADRYFIAPVKDDNIEFEYVETITLNDYKHVTGKKLVSFQFAGITYRENVYALMLKDIIKILDAKDNNVLDLMAKENSRFTSSQTSRVRVSNDPQKLKYPDKIRDGVYVDTGASAWTIMRCIDNLMDKYNVEKESFSIRVIDDKHVDEPETDDEENDDLGVNA